MRNKLHVQEILIFAIAVLPFIYLANVYPGLPAIVPTHFGIDGKPNGFSAKSSLWLIIPFLFAISILNYLIMRYLPKIDPKKAARYSATTFNKIGITIVLFISFINFFIIHSAQNNAVTFGKGLPILVGAFFAFLGNLMPSIKPNYFAGIRTPWTLESEETWRKTHQLAGKLWFAGGILIIILSLFLPEKINTYSLIVIAFIIAIIPIVYSYNYFKAIQKNNN